MRRKATLKKEEIQGQSPTASRSPAKAGGVLSGCVWQETVRSGVLEMKVNVGPMEDPERRQPESVKGDITCSEIQEKSAHGGSPALLSVSAREHP